MSNTLKDIVPYEQQRNEIKLFVLDEFIEALKEAENLGDAVDKFKLRVREW